MIVENINNVFTFGKHKNITKTEVASIDPSYIEWLCKTLYLFFDFSNRKVMRLLLIIFLQIPNCSGIFIYKD